MAKKVKTPEEVKASIDKRVARRKIFFGTFSKALALFLAVAMVYTLAVVAFMPQPTVQAGPSTNNSQNTDDDPFADDGDDAQTPGDDTQTPGGDDTQTPGNTDKPSANEKADAVKAVNDATAKAASAGYDWSRKCYLNKALTVADKDGKDQTNNINGIIHLVNKEMNVDDVVSLFLDITGSKDDAPKTGKKAKGADAKIKDKDGNDMKDKFLFIATKLTEDDVKKATIDGNKYTITLNTCENPKKDGANALNHVTNDFITEEEVATDIARELGKFKDRLVVNPSTVQYGNIKVVAVIENGNLTSFDLTYQFNVKELNLAADIVITQIPVIGKGLATVEASYKNFVY